MKKSVVKAIESIDERLKVLENLNNTVEKLLTNLKQIRGLYSLLKRIEYNQALIFEVLTGETFTVGDKKESSQETWNEKLATALVNEVLSVGEENASDIQEVVEVLADTEPATVAENNNDIWKDPELWAWDINKKNIGFYLAQDRNDRKMIQAEYGKLFPDVGKKKQGLSRATVSAVEIGKRLLPDRWFDSVKSVLELNKSKYSPIRNQVSYFLYLFGRYGRPLSWTDMIKFIEDQLGYRKILAEELLSKAKASGLLKQKSPRGFYYLEGMDISETPLLDYQQKGDAIPHDPPLTHEEMDKMMDDHENCIAKDLPTDN